MLNFTQLVYFFSANGKSLYFLANYATTLSREPPIVHAYDCLKSQKVSLPSSFSRTLTAWKRNFAFFDDLFIFKTFIAINSKNALFSIFYFVQTQQIVSPVSENSFPATSPKNSIVLKPACWISDKSFSLVKKWSHILKHFIVSSVITIYCINSVLSSSLYW